MRKTKNQKEIEKILFGADALYIGGWIVQASHHENKDGDIQDGYIEIYHANYAQNDESSPAFVLTPDEIKNGIVRDGGVEIDSKCEGNIVIEPLMKVPTSFVQD